MNQRRIADLIAAHLRAEEAATAGTYAAMARMSECAPLVGEAIYAFQEPKVVSVVGEITGAPSVQPDPLLYAGGISATGRGDFLNPHLDNSHDRDRARWRAFNLPYYFTPDWPEDAGGGDLELWPDRSGGGRVTIHSRFNRLAVMATHGGSWHSVSPVTGDSVRMCVSNYCFTSEPMRASDTVHPTSFRGHPGRLIADAMLRADAFARGALRKLKPDGVAKVTHVNEHTP